MIGNPLVILWKRDKNILKNWPNFFVVHAVVVVVCGGEDHINCCQCFFPLSTFKGWRNKYQIFSSGPFIIQLHLKNKKKLLKIVLQTNYCDGTYSFRSVVVGKQEPPATRHNQTRPEDFRSPEVGFQKDPTRPYNLWPTFQYPS